MHTDSLGIEEARVIPRENAVNAIGLIDDAINYALDEATYLDSYISRLDFTEANIVTANEAAQASESVIRDADMAKEMTAYTKSNVLAKHPNPCWLRPIKLPLAYCRFYSDF